MDKFVIDLDKVLDDFEINEDREERLAAGRIPHRPNFVSSKCELETPIIPHQEQQLPRPNESVVGWSDVKLYEEEKPDLLGSVKPQQVLSHQQNDSEDQQVLESDGSLPDVTVSSRPVATAIHQQVDNFIIDASDNTCNMDEDPYQPPIIEFAAPPFSIDNPQESLREESLVNVSDEGNSDKVPQLSEDLAELNDQFINPECSDVPTCSISTDPQTCSDTTLNEPPEAPCKVVTEKVIGFSSNEEVSDAELERMLDELEDDDMLKPEQDTAEATTSAFEESDVVSTELNVSQISDETSHVECLNKEECSQESSEEIVENVPKMLDNSESVANVMTREENEVVDEASVCQKNENSCSEQELKDDADEEEEEDRPHRPSSLQLYNEDDQIPYPPGSTVTVGPPGNTPASNVPAASGISYTIPPEEPVTHDSPSGSSSSSSCEAEEASSLPPSLLHSLGVNPPYWVPDSEAPICMHCEAKFTVIKRRHHCRACGKVLCSRCCNHKARLQYLDNAEARVCQSCYPILCAAQDDDSGSNSNSPQRLARSPNPNNPMEYCSTIPPLQQAVGSRNQRPPSVMVPVGVLKRDGSSRNRGEPKQVMFSDGIRPGGDLTDLDGWAEPRHSRKQGRQSRKVSTPAGSSLSPVQGLRVGEIPECRPVAALVPSDLASYTLLADSRPGAFSFDLSADTSTLMETLRNEDEPPVVFALNKNLFVLVKIITLSCCVHKTVWCFTTRGLRCEGQDEMVFILEALPDEKCVPRDVFAHISAVYLEAGKGNTVTELGHTTFHGPFLGSSEHGGFLYIRPTSQCLQRLILPPPPYLVAILLQRWEAPWARLFPLRLLLRLGYEFRYYPCPLVSVRERRPVYAELGQTILDLLADFRNFTYTLPCIQGVVVHMEDRQTSLLIPKNRYDQVIRVLNNSNDHVLALGGSFSREADSHLVCVQADDETYHSKAISILNRPRKVTGASFLVFNGALKSSSGLSAKSSIVEDGLMVQVPADTMQALRTALRDMKDFSVGCGPASVQPPAETVVVSWVDDDHYFNVGVRSQIDGSKLDGVPSIRVHNGTDYRGENCFIRWTEVFLLKCEEGNSNVRAGMELDISRVSESIARAFCVALVPLLDLLATAGLLILAVRVTLHPDNVGYEAGSGGTKLPPLYMRSLDDELVPVIHEAASQAGEGNTILELVFSVMRHLDNYSNL